MKPLLVGECNPYGADPYFALYPLPENASGGRLARILGLSRTDYLHRFDRVNLCEGSWSIVQARKKAKELLHSGKHSYMVLLGAKVCAAFGLEYKPFSRYDLLGGGVPSSTARYIVVCFRLPHPSGLNRAWNDPDAVRNARSHIQQLLQ